jgi:GGDEF domain-containing protein
MLFIHGGEEFIVALPMGIDSAKVVAERIRATIEKPITVEIRYRSRVEAVRAMDAIQHKASSWPEHGIMRDENGKLMISVVERRRGEFYLRVVVQKTVSVGVTEYREGDAVPDLIRRADKAQQAAKHGGRNRVK